MLQFTQASTRCVFIIPVKFGPCLIYSQDKRSIASNIESQARGARALFIWTDCDREGEHIGSEVRTEALKGNGRLEVKRARFSNIERA